MEYINCKLTILNDQKVEYQAPYSVPVTGDLCRDKLTRMTVERLNIWIGSLSSYCQREDLQVLGSHLYHVLFGDEKISKAFEATYKEFETKFKGLKDPAPDRIPKLRLRLTLEFREEAESLASYPWEFIFVPFPNIEKGFFLTGERTELILTRFVAEPGQLKSLQTEKNELKILVVWSQPKELRLIDTSAVEAIGKLLTDIGNLNEQDRIRVMQLPNPTLDALKATINTFTPHIVHFIGHGVAGKIALIKKQEAIEYDLAIGGKGDEADYVDSESLRAAFKDFPPRLVFLHACKGAASDSLGVFKSTARQLLHADIPVVIAMQYEISNEDASIFAKTFYQQIGEGASIDEAVKEGRKMLGEIAPAWSHPRFGTPVVYLQSENGVLFSKARTAPALEKEVAAAPEISSKVDCPYYSCTGKVSVDQKRCSCPRHIPLMRCLNPDCRKVIEKDNWPCIYCEYMPTQSSSNLQQPGVQGEKPKEVVLDYSGQRSAGARFPSNS